MSVFDPQALTKLAQDTKDRGFARDFAQKYRALLDHRVSRITSALDAPDFVDAMDATLSLKVSSTTVGTCELAELAQQIELDVRRRDAPAARMRASTLADAARRADAALERYLVSV